MSKFVQIALSAALLSGLTAGCGKKQVKDVREKEIRVTIEPIRKMKFQRRIPVQGTVNPVEHAVISAKISGTLGLLKAGEGDKLKKGDILFGIDRQILKNQLMVREADILVKRAELESAKASAETAEISSRKAKQDYERYRRLLDSKVASPADFETYETEYKKALAVIKNAQAAVDNATAQMKQAEANLVIAKKNLADSQLEAPFDCVVVNKFVEENEYVTAGQNILSLENHAELEVEAHISAVYYNQITENKNPVEFAVDGKKQGKGVITYKAPSIDPTSRTFKIKARIPKNSPLVSGMLCDMQIILEEKEAFGLPADALLLRSNNRYIVYAIDQNKRAKSFDVQRGIVDGKYCEVLNAEKLLGEKFVVTGQTFVNAGTLLKQIDSGK